MAWAGAGSASAPVGAAGGSAAAVPPNGRRGRPAGCRGHRGCGAWRVERAGPQPDPAVGTEACAGDSSPHPMAQEPPSRDACAACPRGSEGWQHTCSMFQPRSRPVRFASGSHPQSCSGAAGATAAEPRPPRRATPAATIATTVDRKHGTAPSAPRASPLLTDSQAQPATGLMITTPGTRGRRLPNARSSGAAGSPDGGSRSLEGFRLAPEKPMVGLEPTTY